MNTILEAKGLTKAYGDKQSNVILKKIDLQIKEGEFVSIMGPSGSGKSTLLYSISGMDKVTEGSIILEEQELSRLPEKELAHLRLIKMGFIFQHNHLLKHLSILDNIILSAYLAKKWSREEINHRAMKLMEQTGISQLANHNINEASGGQLQRAAICRALINLPKIVFGDEPTGALNTKSAAEVMEILAGINETGTTVLLVTHDAKVAAKTERVLYMVDGEIAGEKQLGKLSEQSDIRAREDMLSKWLKDMGF